jgi:hypothetical protein
MPPNFESLIDVLRDYPAIDNHAHPLLTEENRERLAFEGLTSEAQGAALEDAAYTLAHGAARRDLIRLYDLPRHASWEDVKRHRAACAYDELCRLCFRNAKIQCVLIDDGLGGVKDMAEGYRWHDRYTASPTRRIVRVEVVAQVRKFQYLSIYLSIYLSPPQGSESSRLISSSFQDILVEMFGGERFPGLFHFSVTLRERLVDSAKDPDVAGFKSVVCYRTGLDVATVSDPPAEIAALRYAYERFRESTDESLRLADKPLNDLVVRTTLEVAAEHGKPGTFPRHAISNAILVSEAPSSACSAVPYRPRRRGYYAYARERGAPAAGDRGQPSGHVRTTARQLSVHA